MSGCTISTESARKMYSWTAESVGFPTIIITGIDSIYVVVTKKKKMLKLIFSHHQRKLFSLMEKDAETKSTEEKSCIQQWQILMH